MFLTEFVDVCMKYLHMKFSRPSFNVSLVYPCQTECKCKFHMAGILFYIIEKRYCSESCTHFEICYPT